MTKISTAKRYKATRRDVLNKLIEKAADRDVTVQGDGTKLASGFERFSIKYPVNDNIFEIDITFYEATDSDYKSIEVRKYAFEGDEITCLDSYDIHFHNGERGELSF